MVCSIKLPIPDIFIRAAIIITAAAISSSCYAQSSPSNKKKILTVQEVVNVSLKFHPLIKAAETELDSAQANLLASKGAFDPVLKGSSSGRPEGDYDGSYFDTRVEIPLELLGSTISAGYRKSNGDFPVYEEQFVTNDGGKAQLSLSVPLLRNSLIDKRRLDIQKNKLEQIVASSNVDLKKIDMARTGQDIYWGWVAAKVTYDIYQELLAVARLRDSQISSRVKQGDLPEFDSTDNQRAVLQRESQLIYAEQIVRRSELELSLLLRDENGIPIDVTNYVPPKDNLPVPLKNDHDVAILTNFAKKNRPELIKLGTQINQTEAEIKLAKNQFLPMLNAQASGGRQYGTGFYSDDENELKVGLEFQIPLAYRTPRGNYDTLKAKLRELGLKKEFLSQRVETDIKDALVNLSTAQRRYNVIAKEASAARDLEIGERKRFELGDSTLIFVNIREQAAADAEVRKIEALLSYWRAKAQLTAAQGLI